MELLIWRKKVTQRTKTVILLCSNDPFVAHIVRNAACGIKLKTFQAARVIRIHDRIVDEVPTVKMHTDDWPKLRRDSSRFPVQSIDAKLEIQTVKEFLVVGVRTDKEFTDLEAVSGCAIVGRVEAVDWKI